MIRLILIALMISALAFLVMKIAREVKGANVDWTGVTFIIGFIAIAFYLRHATGLV
ncbi:hypothetical protein ABFT80_06035 [Mesorhizobium sp. SB112]|uniref:hypothetical protein n=1 Tax=Mesorhizobium sp. SB112 TaxID=3151853 RepID=UPI003265440A